MMGVTYRGWLHIYGREPSAAELIASNSILYRFPLDDGSLVPFVEVGPAWEITPGALGLNVAPERLMLTVHTEVPAHFASRTLRERKQFASEPRGAGGNWEARRVGLFAFQQEILVSNYATTYGRLPASYNELLQAHNLVPMDFIPADFVSPEALSGMVVRISQDPPALYLEYWSSGSPAESRVIFYEFDYNAGKSSKVRIHPASSSDVPEAASWPLLMAADLTLSMPQLP